jgi:translocation protein SEC63
MIEVMSAASEFEDASLVGVKRKEGKEFDRFEKNVKERLKDVLGTPLEGKLYRRPSCKRAAVFLYAHLLRVPVDDSALIKGGAVPSFLLSYVLKSGCKLERNAVVLIAHQLTTGLISIALSHNWLSTYLTAVTLQKSLFQATHPMLSPLLQLPHVTPALGDRATSQGVDSIDDFVQLPEEPRATLFSELSERDYKHAVDVAKNWPKLELISAAFKGSDNALASLTVVKKC